MGATPTLIDVGGGLGVDYDGSKTNFHSSMNYSLQEYANDVVAFVQEACDESGVPHPDIVTESGRAMVAHHSVLVFDVLGVDEMLSGKRPEPVGEDDPKVLQDLAEVWSGISKKNVQETYHDALQLKEGGVDPLLAGLPRPARPRPRRAPVLELLREDPAGGAGALDYVPEDLEALEKGARRHVLRQPLGLPVRARPLGREAALPRHADPPARREAHAPRRVRGPHLRQRRQDRPVHRHAAT